MSMGENVAIEIPFPCELSLAHFALVWGLSCVYEHVQTEGAFLSELLAADSAGVAFGVAEEVLTEFFLFMKGFLTYFALVGFYERVFRLFGNNIRFNSIVTYFRKIDLRLNSRADFDLLIKIRHFSMSIRTLKYKNYNHILLLTDFFYIGS